MLHIHACIQVLYPDDDSCRDRFYLHVLGMIRDELVGDWMYTDGDITLSWGFHFIQSRNA